MSMIRASHYHSYLAVAFDAQPLEIWSLTTRRLLRKMSNACPLIVDMAWSGKHHQVPAPEHQGELAQARSVTGADVATQQEEALVYRENLVVLDNDNRLYHVVVKGMHVRDGKEVKTQVRIIQLLSMRSGRRRRRCA